MPVSHLRAWAPCDVTHVPAPTNRTSQERQGSNHDAVTHNSMGKNCWSLCRPYWHYMHNPGLRGVRGAALGCYSLEWGEITPWFTPPRSRLSTPVKPQGQARRHRDDHDSMRRSCIVHRATYVRARRYNIKGQGPLLQQWYATNYRTRLKTSNLPSQERHRVTHAHNPAFPLHL
jgi:hypothetical protein